MDIVFVEGGGAFKRHDTAPYQSATKRCSPTTRKRAHKRRFARCVQAALADMESSITCFSTSEGRKAQSQYIRSSLGRASFDERSHITRHPHESLALFFGRLRKEGSDLIDQVARASVVGGTDGWSLTWTDDCKERLHQDYKQQNAFSETTEVVISRRVHRHDLFLRSGNARLPGGAEENRSYRRCGSDV